jgi:hypothetical protein
MFIAGVNTHLWQIIVKKDPIQSEQDFADHFGDLSTSAKQELF